MVTAATETKLLTADDLFRLHSEGVRGELIRGVLCETIPSGMEHGEIVVNLSTELRNFVKPKRLGRLMASYSGVWLERGPDTVREPDIAFFAAGKIPAGARIQGYAEVVPDLVVEVKSPSDSVREVTDKARMWLSYGARLAWVLHPNRRSVDVHSRDDAVSTVTDGNTLSGGDVLPGFECKVSDIFDVE
jgi:Uma2 family endonuclease